jgi:hypothetical protein
MTQNFFGRLYRDHPVYRTNLNDEDLGTAKRITFLTNSLILIWREGHFAHVARNLLLVEFTKIRGTQNFGRKQSYTYAICTYFGKIFGLKKQHFLP